MSSFNGLGTAFYGECDFQPNGSYVTTCWFIIAFLPIIPLYSARIFSADSGFFSTNYQYEKLPINWLQVLRIWLFVIRAHCGVFVLFVFVDAYGILKGYEKSVFAAYVIGVLMVPYLLRRTARERAANQIYDSEERYSYNSFGYDNRPYGYDYDDDGSAGEENKPRLSVYPIIVWLLFALALAAVVGTAYM